jgi:hypothetical protein
MLVSVSAFTLATALAVSAAHVNPMDIRASHHKRSPAPATVERRLSSDSGEFSWYDAGLGACGGTNSANDFIVALSVQSWDGGSHCNEQVTITANGKTTTATIVDECMGCPPNKLDMSTGLFQFFGGLDLGIMHGSWSSGSGGGSAPPAQDDSKKKQDDADAQKKKDDDAAAQKKKDDDAWAKKQSDDAAQKTKDDDAKKQADDAWAKSSSEAAAKTSSSAAPSSSAPGSSSAAGDASPTGPAAAAAASPTAGAGQAVTQANNLIVQWGSLALAGYQA